MVRSIGYRTVPIEGVPFDPATSTVSNIAGQVAHPSSGEVVAGEYVVGWAKRGPTGRIGNNKADAVATVEVMMADLPGLKGIRDDHRDPSRIEATLCRRGIDYTTYQGWKVLDATSWPAGPPRGGQGSRSAPSRRCWRSSAAGLDASPVHVTIWSHEQ